MSASAGSSAPTSLPEAVAAARRLVLFGPSGSGKTELAVNLAKGYARAGFSVALADLDTVSPLFRSREAARGLQAAAVRLVAPQGELFQADLPAVADLATAFAADRAVVDIGGGEAGARALGSLRHRLEDALVLFVVNTRRPFTGDVAGILRALAEVEGAARVRADGFVANTNLGLATTMAVVEAGLAITAQAAALAGLPVLFTAVPVPLATQAAAARLGTPVYGLERHMLPPWERTDSM